MKKFTVEYHRNQYIYKRGLLLSQYQTHLDYQNLIKSLQAKQLFCLKFNYSMEAEIQNFEQ